jgi:hypothetical protein
MSFEQTGNDISASANKHWREVAEYERYVVPLRIRLQAVDWRALITLNRTYWHRKAIGKIRARKQQYGSYCWVGNFCNPSTGTYRQIQRYSLVYLSDFGAYPIRLCPLREQHEEWGWFRPSDIGTSIYTPEADRRNPNWTPEAHAWSAYEKQRGLYGQALQNIDDKRSKLQPRQYLADRLLNISRQLGKYVRKNHWNANGIFYEEPYELEWHLNQALASNEKLGYLSTLSSAALGEVEAKLDHFWRCLEEFHAAETPAPVVKATINNQLSKEFEVATDLSPTVHKRLDYFPQLLARLCQCPVWDIDEALNEAITSYKLGESDLSQGLKFTSRVKHYCEQISMDNARRERILNWALWAYEKKSRLLQLLEFPESRQLIKEDDRKALTGRLESLRAGLGIMQRTGKTNEIPKWEENIVRVESRIAELDIAKQLILILPQPTTDIAEQQLDTPAVPNLFDKLCGGFTREQLERAIGQEGLGLYDSTKKEQTDTATSTSWALLYWGLKHKGFLPIGLSAGRAAELLKSTFGATTSKTRINDTKPRPNEKPSGYLAHVVDLLSTL